MHLYIANPASPWLAEVVAPILAFDPGLIIIILIIIFMGISSAIAEAKKKQELEKRRQQRAQRAKQQPEKEDGDEGWEPVPAQPRPLREMADDDMGARIAAAREARARADAQWSRRAQPTSQRGERERAEPREATGGAFHLGALDQGDLARAIVLAEVLGPPVALRDDPIRHDEGTPHRLV